MVCHKGTSEAVLYIYWPLCIYIYIYGRVNCFPFKFPCRYPDIHVPAQLRRLMPVGDNVSEQRGSPRFAAHVRHGVSDSRAMTSQLAPGNQ